MVRNNEIIQKSSFSRNFTIYGVRLGDKGKEPIQKQKFALFSQIFTKMLNPSDLIKNHNPFLFLIMKPFRGCKWTNGFCYHFANADTKWLLSHVLWCYAGKSTTPKLVTPLSCLYCAVQEDHLIWTIGFINRTVQVLYLN